MSMSVGLHICLHTMYIAGALGSQKSVLDFLELELMGIDKASCGFWETNLDFLQEQKITINQ